MLGTTFPTREASSIRGRFAPGFLESEAILDEEYQTTRGSRVDSEPLGRENTMSDDSPASIYETQLVAAIFEPLARILIERARPELGEHVLDATCGTGIVARLVAPMVGPSGKTVGLDYDPIMIENLSAAAEN
jgi:SAM-dependent methyltransferase